MFTIAVVLSQYSEGVLINTYRTFMNKPLKSNQLTIAYWADSELAFVKFARELTQDRNLSFNLVRITHHHQWFSADKSILKNLSHLTRIFVKLAIFNINCTIVCFGTNSSRVLFFFSFLFKNTYYVYNELPSLSPNSPLTWLDKVIFRLAKNISVSTIERATLVRQSYNLSRNLSILENITFTEIPALYKPKKVNQIIFSGTINQKRFSETDIEKLLMLSKQLDTKIDVYGGVASEINDKFLAVLDYKGKVSHSEIMKITASYKYGLLTYYTNEPNYDYCAPIKLYEYVASGCLAISLNRNKGLLGIASRYPTLINFVDDLNDDFYISIFDHNEDFYEQRLSFLSNAISSNFHFAEKITSDI